MAKNLTNFLISLSADPKLRDKFRDTTKRTKLLEQWGLENEPVLQAGATVEQVEAAVVAEGGNPRQVEWWIRSASVPVLNEDYDPTA